MRAWHRMRVRQLREIIDFRELPKPEDPTRGVVAEWPDPRTLLESPGWEIFFQNTWYEDGGAQREWVLKRKVPKGNGSGSREERLAVRIFVSSTGYARALRHFRRLVMSTTTLALDAKVEHVGPGHIQMFPVSAPIPGEEHLHNDSLIAKFQNITFDLRSYGTDIDLRQVANRLLSIAQKSSGHPLRENQPPIARPNLPQELPPGSEITIELPTAPDPFGSFAGTELKFQVQTQGEAAFRGFHDKGALFRLQAPGYGQIRVQAIDRRTLLSKEVALGMNVRASESAAAPDQ